MGFTGVFLASGECMGPPPNVHGGCIFSLHADCAIGYMQMHASSLGVKPSKGSLKELTVNFRKLCPLWLTYAVRVHVVSHRCDVASASWMFTLKSEMVNAETDDLHNEAISEFECDTHGFHELLPYELAKMYGVLPVSAL